MSERLYGQPLAEVMFTSPVALYESEDLASGNVIEEWSVCDPRSHAPGADTVVSWVAEQVAEYGEVDECASGEWDAAAKDADVIAAFDAALDLVASKVNYRMANKHLRDLVLVYDTDGAPTLDGSPLYRDGTT